MKHSGKHPREYQISKSDNLREKIKFWLGLVRCTLRIAVLLTIYDNDKAINHRNYSQDVEVLKLHLNCYCDKVNYMEFNLEYNDCKNDLVNEINVLSAAPNFRVACTANL